MNAPPQVNPGLLAMWRNHREQRHDRITDYQRLRAWGWTREQAAERVGVGERTAYRYEAALKEDA